MAIEQILRRFGDVRLAVLGDVMLDRFVFGAVDRVSPEAPVPILRIDRTEAMLGGAGNVALNVARLGGRAVLLGLVGSDADGGTVRDQAAAEAGLRPLLETDPDGRTTTKTRFVASGQQLMRADAECHPPSAQVLATLAREVGAITDVAGFVCSDYAKGVVTAEVFSELVSTARRIGAFVIADPKRPDLAFYAGADIITPNAREAAAATGIGCEQDDDVAGAASAIADMTGCRTVVVTRGPKGMTVLERGSERDAVHHLPTRAQEVFNVSGAGDTVVATLAMTLAAGGDIETASRLANVAAGLSVGKVTTWAVDATSLRRAVDRLRVSAAEEKVAELSKAAARVRAWQGAGDRVAFANGCFDLLHPGHLSLLRQARSEGDRLVVAINSDASVRRLKGPNRPLQGEAARAAVLASLSVVDLVLIFDEDTPEAAIEAVRPDVLVKGAEYRAEEVVGGRFVQGYGGRVVLAAMVDGHSTTATVGRMRAPLAVTRAGSDDAVTVP